MSAPMTAIPAGRFATTAPHSYPATVRLPIVAFSKDWHEDATSNHHVLRELAKTRRVLWLNSVGTRRPNLGNARDLGKLGRKVREFTRGPINVENDLWVFSPLAIPLPHQAWARAANATILRGTIRALRSRLGINAFELWTFLPNAGPYVGALGEARSVYYCVDEWSMFSYVDRTQLEQRENELLAKVDVVFAINQALVDRKAALHSSVHLSPHGVDAAHFAKALTMAPTPELAKVSRPILGFYGTLQDWVDYELLVAIAQARPDWSLVLVGQELVDVSALRKLPNVTILPRRDHAELPALCAAFDVGLIPYRIDERMAFVNPLKLREYLAAGLPVVSTRVPEVLRVAGLVPGCAIADDAAGFIAAIEAALAADSPAARQARSAAMQHETWAARAAAIDEVLTKTIAAKGPRQ